jgi:hypothetical protein
MILMLYFWGIAKHPVSALLAHMSRGIAPLARAKLGAKAQTPLAKLPRQDALATIKLIDRKVSFI